MRVNMEEGTTWIGLVGRIHPNRFGNRLSAKISHAMSGVRSHQERNYGGGENHLRGDKRAA